MDDHHHHHAHHHPFMTSSDLRHLINGTPTHFHPRPPELFSAHQHYELRHQMVGLPVSDLLPRALHEFPADSTPAPPAAVTSASTPNATTFDCDASGTGRWPRQETLTLLEIRSRLDHKFKEANQKGPLWDEVSRIMSEEHGFQRSGKKCREKFENLYKYYKKTKEGKVGRQDGKHYRFFRQLEALYGETRNPVSVPETHLPVVDNDFPTTFHSANTSNPNSLSLSGVNSSEFESCSSDESMPGKAIRKRRGSSTGKSWKAKIKGFIDSQMKKLIDRQEAWLEKVTSTLEQKEQERRVREEEWRQQEAARLERERRFWTRERAWIEARDAAIMEALHNITGKILPARASPPEEIIGIEAEAQNHVENLSEINNGGDTTNYKAKEKIAKKRKENSRTLHGNYTCAEGGPEMARIHGNESSSPSNSTVGNTVNDSCFRFLMADGDQNFWENYGLKINKGET